MVRATSLLQARVKIGLVTLAYDIRPFCLAADPTSPRIRASGGRRASSQILAAIGELPIPPLSCFAKPKTKKYWRLKLFEASL
jgi:hypothetical protein